VRKKPQKKKPREDKLRERKGGWRRNFRPEVKVFNGGGELLGGGAQE